MAYFLRASERMADLEEIETRIKASAQKIAEILADPWAAGGDALQHELMLVSDVETKFNRLSIEMMQGPGQELFTPVHTGTLNPVQWHTVQQRAHAMGVTFRHWRKVQAQIKDQVTFRAQKLYATPPAPGSIKARHVATSDRIFDKLHDVLNPNGQSEACAEAGAHPDIGLPHSLFVAHLQAAHRVVLAQKLGRAARFLDVGCGAGLTLLSAAQYFGTADGLDFEPAYVKAARRFAKKAGLDRTRVFQADALAFKKYGTYDVIYFFWPIRDEELMIALEERITHMARPGTVVIAPYELFSYRAKGLGCAQIAGQLYLAKSTRKEASALRRMAERMGPYVALDSAGVSKVWAPVEAVLASNGFRQGVRDLERY